MNQYDAPEDELPPVKIGQGVYQRSFRPALPDDPVKPRASRIGTIGIALALIAFWALIIYSIL
jgi:hypothetical protein